MTDPFAQPTKRCGECGAIDGHRVNCEVMALEVADRQKARNGVCQRCWLVRPCGCDS